MGIETNLNTEPYFDDFDENKNFHQILFQPGKALQAREVTQLQTIFQNQIERFGSHVFKDGSVVNGCTPQSMPSLNFIRTEDFFNTNQNRDINDIDSSYLIVGATSNVRAVSLSTKEGRLSLYPDTNRFYIKYLNSGVNNETTFQSGEILNIYTANQNKLETLNANNLLDTINVLTSNVTANAIGVGYGMNISDGLVFQKGFFQRVESQLVIVRDYDQDTTDMVVGFETVETIVTEESDSSLYDNALGSPNYNAPGAHRLKLTPTLVARNKSTVVNNDSFFVVYEFSNVDGTLVQINNDPTYNQLGDVMGSRTFESDGNFVIKPFMVETLPHANNSLKFKYQVDPGVAYVHGRRIEYFASKSVDTDRATDTKEDVSQIITTNYGNYIIVDELCGSFEGLETVSLYDTAQLAITNRRFLTSPLGSVVGTAQIKTIIHDNGIKGVGNTTYLMYITNIIMNSGKSFSSDVKSIYSSNGTGVAVADGVLASSKLILQESNRNQLVFPFGKNAIKTLRSANGTINRTEFISRVTANGTLQANGLISVTMAAPHGGGTDSLNYSTGTLTESLENDFFVVLSANTSTANLSGTINVSSGSNTITGTGTTFTSIFANNEFIELKSDSTTDFRRIVSVSNNTSLVVDALPTFSNTSSVFSKFYPEGYIVPLNSTLPGTRNINITSNTTFEVNTGLASAGNLTSTQNTFVNFKTLRTTAVQKKKDIQRDIYIKLHANTLLDGKLNLGVTDVFNLKNIYAGNTYSESNKSVLNYFSLDTGQRDDVYDHAKLILNPKYQGILTDELLLVKLDKFTSNTSGGIGFYSVDSYPIDDANTSNTNAIQTSQIPVYTTSSGYKIDLRDAVDFRVYKAETANNTTVIADATINPVTSNTITQVKYVPEPDSNFQTDITYYLGRYDLVNINTSGGINVIKGIPSEYPRKPQPDLDSMTIATSYVPPYPSITSRENVTLGRKDYSIRTSITTNRNYTKKDINTLDKRVERLEYHATLNLLEQQAKDLQIPDGNGLNRFKNGIFADPLNSHAFGDTTDFEYKIAIDSTKGVGRPLFKTQNIDLVLSNTSTDIQQTDNIITLPFTNELLVKQPFASKYRNCTEDFWSWNGSIELYPQYDMARDETSLPNIDASIDLTQPFLDFAQTIGTTSNTSIFGTRFGDWRINSQTTNRTTTNDSFSITTSTNSIRDVSNTFIVPVTNTVDLGRYLTDISIQPFMRTREIAVIARNLKPNTKMYIYFDRTAVSEYCAPAILSDVRTNREDSILTRTDIWGAQLKTDSNGNLYCKFLIPANTFRVGDRTLLITDVSDLNTGESASQTKAYAVFTASNIELSSRTTTLSTSIPRIQTTNRTETQTSTVVTTWSNPQQLQPSSVTTCCFLPNTLVYMADGSKKKIVDVQVGDVVLGDNGGLNTVLNTKTTTVGNRNVIKIGNVEATDDHLFMTQLGWKTFVPARLANRTNSKFLNDLTPITNSDLFKFYSDGEFTFINHSFEIITYPENTFVYDLTLTGDHTYIVEGFVVHNCAGDPIAQTYTVKSPNGKTGIFGTTIKLYFKTKDPTLGVTVVICPTIAGIPDISKAIASKHLPSSSVNVSDYADSATTFTFSPTYHDSDNEYSFVVMPDGNSPNYTIWLAEVGGFDVTTGSQIYSSPYSGSALKSSNSRTWTQLTKEQIKFEFYVANFSLTPGNAIFKNDDDDYINYTSLSLANSSVGISVGDEIYSGYANGSIANVNIKGIIQNLNTTESTFKIDTSSGNF
jgi:hypothetical protein